VTPWSPSAAREAVRAEVAEAERGGYRYVARGLRDLPDAAFDSPETFVSTLREEELHTAALLALVEPSCTWCGSHDHTAATCSDKRRRRA
jgi:hypothetical protein